MRATGSNISGPKDLSILIHRGGLSFFDRQSGRTDHYKTVGSTMSPHEACAAVEGYYSLHPGHGSVMVVAAGRCATVVPEKLFDADNVRGYMRFSGMEPAAGQEVMTVHRSGMVFITAMDKALRERLDTIYGDAAVVDPLLLSVAYAERRASRGTVATVDVAGDTMALTLRHGKRLLFMDTLPVASHEDMVFYMERLLKDNGLRDPSVVCAGMTASATAEVLRPYYEVETVRAEEYFVL